MPTAALPCCHDYSRLLVMLMLLLTFNHFDWSKQACVTPQCRRSLKSTSSSSSGGAATQFSDSAGSSCKPFYLIPGKAIDCSTKDLSDKILTIDPSSVRISPNPVKLPGCFNIQMDVHLLPNDLPKSYVSKVEFNWLNLPQFSALPCQNQSSNGCGGYGNNCYYCDVCNSLEEIKNDDEVSKGSLSQQFSDLTCPSKPGPYSFNRRFCFNDFKEFDKDGDCQFDFLQEDGLASNYKDALKNLQQVGYGTVTAKFLLATNATNEQEKQKNAKELEIDRTIDAELLRKRQENGWAVDDDQYLAFRNWYTNVRKSYWHKQEYLPWILYYNRVGCLMVSFNVCDKEPTPLSSGQTWQCV